MISIIIPVYNTAAYLNQCLQSVLHQSYKDWECILVDDGSQDTSPEICDEWCRKDTRYKVIHQCNQGVSAARNNGLSKAHGKYICFIDSDDWVRPDYLRNLIDHIGNSNLAVSGLVRDYADHTVESRCKETRVIYLNEDYAAAFTDLNRLSLLFGPVVKLYKTEIIKNNQICFPKGCSYGEDLIFNYTYLRYVNSISCVDSVDYHYRMVGESSLSGKLRPNQFDEDYGQWQIVKDLYLDKNMWNDSAKEYMYNKLWGIVYDGIFLYPKLNNPGICYIKYILRIPEIEDLGNYSHTFKSSEWIRKSIVNRLSLVLFLYFKLF